MLGTLCLSLPCSICHISTLSRVRNSLRSGTGGPGLSVVIGRPAENMARQDHNERQGRIVPRGLEPIQEVVESEESDVIHCRAPESKRGGARCGRLNIAAQRTVAVCDIDRKSVVEG